MVSPTEHDFYIAFEGSPQRFECLRRFYDELARRKASINANGRQIEDVEIKVASNCWIDIIDAETFDRLTSSEGWRLEDILYFVLNAEYDLLELSYEGTTGRLCYDPWSFPFGGTDPLKGMIEQFGLYVTRDSLHDGFLEWQRERDK